MDPFPLTPEQKELFSFLPNPSRIECQRGIADFHPETPENYFLYTGRGPSKGSFHIGHLPSLTLLLDIQKFLKIEQKTFFMIADDEKIMRDGIGEKEMEENVRSTLAQLNALGFTEENTLFHINSEHGIPNYPLLVKLMSLVNVNQLNHIFGEKKNIGEYFYPLLQILPCFLYPEKQCIVVSGKDQDPFFRLARDLAHRVGMKPPIILYVKSVPGLDGTEKMSTSIESTLPIYLSDGVEAMKEKVMKIKKVGAGSLQELFEKGADLENDIPFQLLLFFDKNVKTLELVRLSYTSGITKEEDKKELATLIENPKGVKEKDGRMVLTSFGIRLYLIKVLSYLF